MAPAARHLSIRRTVVQTGVPASSATTPWKFERRRCRLGPEAARAGPIPARGSQVQTPVAAQCPRQVRALAPVEAPDQRAPSACEKRFAKDATGFRECLREDRRVEVRTLVTRRLTAMSLAVAEFIGTPSIKDGEIAIAKTGKPAA